MWHGPSLWSVCVCHPCLGLNLIFFCIFMESMDSCNQQFPKRLNRLLKRTMLQLGSKDNLEMKANLLTESGSEIRHFLFLLQPSWKYQFRRQFGILFKWWYGLWSGNQMIFLDLKIVFGEKYRCSFLLLKLKCPIPNIPQLSRRKYDFDTVLQLYTVHLCHQTFNEK